MLSVPDQMRFVGVTTPGGPESLKILQAPVPHPGSAEVLIRTHAAGVNGADLRERQGKYPVPPGAPDIMGLEIAGEIVAVGEGCVRFKPGDLVCALLIGGYAEYATAPEGQCMAIPATVSSVDAAGLPEVFVLFDNMMDRCGLLAGETVLVQGGRVVLAMPRLPRVWCHGICHRSHPRKCAAMRDFGVDLAINYSDEDFTMPP